MLSVPGAKELQINGFDYAGGHPIAAQATATEIVFDLSPKTRKRSTKTQHPIEFLLFLTPSKGGVINRLDAARSIDASSEDFHRSRAGYLHVRPGWGGDLQRVEPLDF